MKKFVKDLNLKKRLSEMFINLIEHVVVLKFNFKINYFLRVIYAHKNWGKVDGELCNLLLVINKKYSNYKK